LIIYRFSRHQSTYVTHHGDVGYDTLNRYSYSIAPCVALLVRTHISPSDEYSFDIPPHIRTLCDELVAAFQQAEDPTAVYEDDADAPPEIPDNNAEDDEEFMVASEDVIDGTPEPTSAPKPVRSAHGPSEIRATPTYCPIIQPKLRKLLVALYSQVPGEGSFGSFFSVIMHYLMLSSIRAHGQWIPSGRITHTIAALTFGGRLTLYSHMDDGLEEGQAHQYHQCVVTF
jgi:hypothetical protein